MTHKAIIAMVAEHYGLSVDRLLGRDRSDRVALPRHMAMHLCRTYITPRPPHYMISAWFKRERSAVTHACLSIGNLPEPYKSDLITLEQRLIKFLPEASAPLSELIGKAIILRCGHDIQEAKIEKLSRSGQYAYVRFGKSEPKWVQASRYTVMDAVE